MSQRDTTGHGTHTTTTTMAGNPVGMASMLGLGQGTTRDGGLHQHKLPFTKHVGLMAARKLIFLPHFMISLLANGIDIIPVSVGGKENYSKYFRDGFSIGAFHAMKSGILTVFVRGNSCPQRSFLTSCPSWAIVVVATASTLDRKFVTKFILEDNKNYKVNPYFYHTVEIPLCHLPLLKNKESHKDLIC